MAARFFWDADTDSYAHDVFMNVSIDFYNGKYKAVVSCSTDKSSHWFCFFFLVWLIFFFCWVFGFFWKESKLLKQNVKAVKQV